MAKTKKRKPRKRMRPAKKKTTKKKEKGPEPIRVDDVPWKLSQITAGLKARRDELAKYTQKSQRSSNAADDGQSKQ